MITSTPRMNALNEPSPNPYEATLKQAFELWINPEIARRRAAGVLEPDFTVYAAQVIMNVGTPLIVRLNEEIKGVLKGRALRAFTKGDVAQWDDLAEVHSVELTTEDANAGHMTVILHNAQWFMQFDFRYNAERIASTVAAAREFLDAAAFSAERGNTRAFCDTLFSAIELLAKGTLLMNPDEAILTSKKHDYVASSFNRWGKFGNVDMRFVSLLNRCAQLRLPARYVHRDVTLARDEMNAMLVCAEEMLMQLRQSAPQRASAA
jgi:uncharacterized protein (UPF0332 family)